MLLVSQGIVEQKIFMIREYNVMIDKELATLYGIKATRLREQVKRNKKRFPEDFMFQLTIEEADALVSQNAIPSRKHLGGYLPYVFTEQGVAMLSSVINSERAVQVNIAIMRAFVKLRQIFYAHKELSGKLGELERKIEKHDTEIQAIFEAIRQLMAVPEKPKRKIGFHSE